MSKGAQRKNNIIAEGRNWALKGHARDYNPYRHAASRALWYQGWEEGEVLYRKRRREAKRQRRISSSRFWRGWYGFWDLMNGEIRAAKTPARRRGSSW